MSDFQIRVAVVVGAILLTIFLTALLRARSSRPVRDISAVELAPGIYFFSSSACADCESARALLTERLGVDGFVEFRWEDDPASFQQIGVSGVPATLRVDSAGSGRLWQGSPSPMFSDVDP